MPYSGPATACCADYYLPSHLASLYCTRCLNPYHLIVIPLTSCATCRSHCSVSVVYSCKNFFLLNPYSMTHLQHTDFGKMLKSVYNLISNFGLGQLCSQRHCYLWALRQLSQQLFMRTVSCMHILLYYLIMITCLLHLTQGQFLTTLPPCFLRHQ